MPEVCVDASLVLALLLTETHSERAAARWQSWRSQGITPIGPPILYAEVTSVLREAVYRGRISPHEGEEAFDTFCAFPIKVLDLPDLHRLAWGLARQYNQPRVYDAMYLAAAQAVQCELWTGDRRLVNAVNRPWVRWIGDYLG